MRQAGEVSCKNCDHYEETTIFELCKHATSLYTADGKQGFHTVQHMRKHLCINAALFKAR